MVASPPTFWAKRYFSGFCDALRLAPFELLRLELRERLEPLDFDDVLLREFEVLLREFELLLRELELLLGDLEVF